MSEMYFKSILISDIQAHKACFQEFSKGFNVITSTDNHVGKSSLLKSLYYAMGAEVEYDSIWDKNSKLYVVKFCVDNQEFRIARFQKSFAVFMGDKLILLTRSVSHDLAKKLGEILGFTVYLPNKKTKKIEMAPPAFTFMPYYIDQDTGWSGLYNSFSYIDQYKKDDRIRSLYYHLNIYTRHTVELMAQRDKLKEEISQIEEDEQRIKIILEGLSQEIQNLLPAETIDELEQNLRIPKEDIAFLVGHIGEVRNKIQTLETTFQQHGHQLQVIQEYHQIKAEVDSSKKKNIHACPQCGYTFDEEIYNIVRANYNLRNEEYMCQQIQLIMESINEELERYKQQYLELMAKLKEKEQIFDESQDAYGVYTRQRGLKDSVDHFNQQLGDSEFRKTEINETIKQISKELSKLPNKKEVEEKYIEYVRFNIIHLDAWNPSYEGNIKLLKPIKAQGTLENKIILAQVVGLFQTMDYFKSNAIRLPFVVDSPRAKEASLSSSKEILKLIFEVKMLPQVILATMDYQDFATEITVLTNTIFLKEKKSLLNADAYLRYQEYIKDLIELLKDV